MTKWQRHLIAFTVSLCVALAARFGIEAIGWDGRFLSGWWSCGAYLVTIRTLAQPASQGVRDDG